MKKKILFIATIVGMAMFTGCQRFDFEEARQEAIRQNAENIFGKIDPNQDWNSSVSGTVTITADAPLYDVASVQILTESPFMNDDARVVAEAKVQKGQSVTLDYDVLNSYETLVAACVDSKGHYYITTFKVTDSQVSFTGTATTRAARRAAAMGAPDASLIKVEFSNSELSFNAGRAIAGESGWENSGWENDRLWKVSKVADLGNGWKMDLYNSDGKTANNDMVIYREVDDLSAQEEAELKAIFNTTLFRRQQDDKGKYQKVKNNIDRIRNSTQVTLYSNHLISDGKNAITITPVMMPSTDIRECNVYYYYFNPDNKPASMSESEYIKQLPKFKAIQCSHASKEAERRGKVVGNMNADNDFFRIYEYILPYFGDGKFDAATMPQTFTTDNKLYRFKHLKKENKNGTDYTYYLTYTGTTDRMSPKLATLYDDNAENVANQLWQIFETSDGNQILYNVGSQLFLTDDESYTILTDDHTRIEKSFYHIVDKGNYIIIETPRGCLGSDLTVKKGSYRVATNKTENDGDRARWTMEEYTGNAQFDGIKTSYELPVPFVQQAVSSVIPAGYKVGMMLRNVKYKGELYSNGELNVLPNRYITNFHNAIANGMHEDDTRMAIFTANGKTYIAFEDGADTNYSDMILELGGFDTEVVTDEIISIKNSGTSTSMSLYTSNGVQKSQLYDEKEVQNTSYLLLFEDRATSADYDMNDVVLRCTRFAGNSDYVELSLIAAGGTDNVVIRGIDGTFINGYFGTGDLNGLEVHDIFGVSQNTGYDRIINTIPGRPTINPRSGIYKMADGLSIPQFLAKIYIENQTTGERIYVPKTADVPVAIIMPFDFPYPKEKEMISDAYKKFLNWAQDATADAQWYNYYEEEDVYPIENISGSK